MSSDETILNKNDPKLEFYRDLVELFPDAVFVGNEHGTYFQRNKLVYWLSKKTNMEQLHEAFDVGIFPLKDFLQFHMDIGYGLCGFTEIFERVIDDMKKKGITFRDLK